MECSEKKIVFSKDILVTKFLDLLTLLSYTPIYLMYVLIGVNRFGITEENALEITCFAKFNYHTAQLFHKMKIIKFVDLG